MAGDRWPPVYDAEDLVREIKRLTASDDALAGVGVRRDGFDELVAEPLVVSLVMVVFDVLREQVPEMAVLAGRGVRHGGTR